jgi:hypothetical protein
MFNHRYPIILAAGFLTVKAMPGRVYETRVSGGMQVQFSGNGTINMYFKADDPDHKVYITQYTCNFHTGSQMLWLVPGQTLHFTGDATMSVNLGNASGDCKIAVDNADYFMAFALTPKQKGSSAGDLRISGGGPGATMDIYAQAYMGTAEGGMGERLDILYDWVDGPAPK